jgi:hypothetical protein
VEQWHLTRHKCATDKLLGEKTKQNRFFKKKIEKKLNKIEQNNEQKMNNKK